MKMTNCVLAATTALTFAALAEEPATPVTDEAFTESLGVVALPATKAAEIAVSTPWVSSSGASLTVASIITTGLTDGDQLSVYHADTGKYDVYQWDGAKWVAATDSSSTEQSVADAGNVQIPPGTAVWYKRAAGADDGKIVLSGSEAESVTSTTLTSASKVSNAILVNPFAEGTDDILAKIGGSANKGDQIWVYGSDVRYTYNGTSWFYKDSSFKNVTVTTVPVPAGTAFWYMTAKKGATRVVTWLAAPASTPAE